MDLTNTLLCVICALLILAALYERRLNRKAHAKWMREALQRSAPKGDRK